MKSQGVKIGHTGLSDTRTMTSSPMLPFDSLVLILQKLVYGSTQRTVQSIVVYRIRLSLFFLSLSWLNFLSFPSIPL